MWSTEDQIHFEMLHVPVSVIIPVLKKKVLLFDSPLYKYIHIEKEGHTEETEKMILNVSCSAKISLSLSLSLSLSFILNDVVLCFVLL